MATSKKVAGKRPAKSRKLIGEAAASANLVDGSDQPEVQESKRAKPPRPPYTKFKRLENRQKTVEQNRRAVYAHLDKITQENINLAQKGNSAIAKFLFEFAGINQFPALGEASSKAGKSASGGYRQADDDPAKAVLSFCEKLGMPFPQLKPPKAVEADEELSEEQFAI